MQNYLLDIWGICSRYPFIQFVLQGLVLFLFSQTAIAPALAASRGCPADDGQVARAMFTTRIEDREPADRVLVLEDKYKRVYFFTDLRDLQGREITHRWEHNGRVVFEKTFAVKGPRWRVYSTLQLDDSSLGRWTVIVSEKNGCPLKAVVFQYVHTDPNTGGSAIIELK